MQNHGLKGVYFLQFLVFLNLLLCYLELRLSLFVDSCELFLPIFSYLIHLIHSELLDQRHLPCKLLPRHRFRPILGVIEDLMNSHFVILAILIHTAAELIVFVRLSP